jgi:hypothetical protein
MPLSEDPKYKRALKQRGFASRTQESSAIARVQKVLAIFLYRIDSF